MVGKMKKFILSICNQKMSDQYVSIEKEFKSWMGENEQVDDVCILGIKV